MRPSELLGMTGDWERALLDVAVAVHAESAAGERLQMLSRINPLMAIMAMGGAGG